MQSNQTIKFIYVKYDMMMWYEIINDMMASYMKFNLIFKLV